MPSALSTVTAVPVVAVEAARTGHAVLVESSSGLHLLTAARVRPSATESHARMRCTQCAPPWFRFRSLDETATMWACCSSVTRTRSGGWKSSRRFAPPPRGVLIFHAMELTDKFRPYLQEN
ncbi:hypothetical protein D9R06_09965 [Kocuria marina subsp. indica]|nr:hypothetical protein D9R06_09965 [Kocuria indica]